MSESQSIEYKSSWRDEYLKWVCGFANAKGGTLYVGIGDDGSVTGLSDARRLLEDIPNKIISGLGIVAAVMLHETRQVLSRDRGGGAGLPGELQGPVLRSRRRDEPAFERHGAGYLPLAQAGAELGCRARSWGEAG